MSKDRLENHHFPRLTLAHQNFLKIILQLRFVQQWLTFLKSFQQKTFADECTLSNGVFGARIASMEDSKLTVDHAVYVDLGPSHDDCERMREVCPYENRLVVYRFRPFC